MKKLISILLVIVVIIGIIFGIIFMTQPDKENPEGPTVAPTEEVAPTDETTDTQGNYMPTPGYPSSSEIDTALQSAQATVFSWTSNETFTMVAKGLGFKELDFTNHVISDGNNYYNKNGQVVDKAVPSATIHSIQFAEEKIRVEFSWYEFEDKYEEDGWVLYCTKADSVADISGLNPDDYDVYDAFDHNKMTGESSDFVQVWKYMYIKDDSHMAFVTAFYYPNSNNLYNLVKVYDHIPDTSPQPQLLCKNESVAEDYLLDTDFTLTFIDGYPVITSEFGISIDGQVEYYKYRVGMTLANWAASELNTSGWVVGFDNTICSPDYRYRIYGFDNGITAHSDFLDDGIYVAQESPYDYIEAMIAIMDTPLTSVPVAHLVDWQSPLLVDGFAIEGKHNQGAVSNYGYQMFNMGYAYEAGETLDIYIRNIQPDMLDDIRLYVFKDSVDLLADIETAGSWQSHKLPLPADSPMLTIPEGATYVTFEEIPTPNTHNPAKVAVAHYDMTTDPNFNAESANAFVLTYKGKVVYWIHMPVWMSEFVEGEVPVEETEYITQEEAEALLKEQEELNNSHEGHNH